MAHYGTVWSSVRASSSIMYGPCGMAIAKAWEVKTLDYSVEMGCLT